MKVLPLRGNPRATGLTAYFTDLFAAGSVDAGAALTDVRLDPRQALVDRLITLEGNRSLFARLPRLFRPVSG